MYTKIGEGRDYALLAYCTLCNLGKAETATYRPGRGTLIAALISYHVMEQPIGFRINRSNPHAEKDMVETLARLFECAEGSAEFRFDKYIYLQVAGGMLREAGFELMDEAFDKASDSLNMEVFYQDLHPASSSFDIPPLKLAIRTDILRTIISFWEKHHCPIPLDLELAEFQVHEIYQGLPDPQREIFKILFLKIFVSSH